MVFLLTYTTGTLETGNGTAKIRKKTQRTWLAREGRAHALAGDEPGRNRPGTEFQRGEN